VLNNTVYPAPSKTLQLLELRAFSEFGASLALLPLLRRAPRAARGRSSRARAAGSHRK
jgi:hypothetical protein